MGLFGDGYLGCALVICPNLKYHLFSWERGLSVTSLLESAWKAETHDLNGGELGAVSWAVGELVGVKDRHLGPQNSQKLLFVVKKFRMYQVSSRVC